MKTVRRLLYRDIVSSVFFVALAFLSLFFFIDFVDELADVGKGYTAFHAALHSILELPGHLYELVPIAVLIGTIYALSRMAQSSEFTILRTGGLAPGRALTLLAGLGVAFAVMTFVVGDYVAPLSERAATLVQSRAKGGFSVGERQDHDATGRALLFDQRRARQLGRRAAQRPRLRVRPERPAAAPHRRGQRQREQGRRLVARQRHHHRLERHRLPGLPAQRHRREARDLRLGKLPARERGGGGRAV
jgi:hypothetical protein